MWSSIKTNKKKTAYIKMIEVLKEEINKSLKEIQNNPNKKCEKMNNYLKKSRKAQRRCGKTSIKLHFREFSSN